LVDGWYDPYLGVVILIRVIDGTISKGSKVKMVATGSTYTIESVGIFTPEKQIVSHLSAGDVGFFTASIKEVSDCKIGDTIVEEKNENPKVLKGFNPHAPVVFCGLYTTDSKEFEKLRDSLAKLKLNDSSFEYEMESSSALGIGFRCGFLGLLHLEIIQERLEREFNLDLITTAPSVIYKILTTQKKILEIHNPADMPDPVSIESIQEPWITATLITPDKYMGSLIELCTEKRGKQINIAYTGTRVVLTYSLPLNEIVLDFHDKLKSYSQGYASFDWAFDAYKDGDLVKLAIMINASPVDAFSMIVHKDKAYYKGRALCEKLKELIPKQQYQVAIQAAIGNKVIARETISALRKDVTAKCYGGDITRKRKLLEKQKEGKKKMRTIGNIDIPKSVFIKALKI
jgi:GTP-binding protein LepA